MWVSIVKIIFVTLVTFQGQKPFYFHSGFLGWYRLLLHYRIAGLGGIVRLSPLYALIVCVSHSHSRNLLKSVLWCGCSIIVNI